MTALPMPHHNLGNWAFGHGMESPDKDARLIAELQPAAIRQTAQVLDSLSPALASGERNLNEQAGQLRSAWSAAEPVNYLLGLAVASGDAGRVVDSARARLNPAVEALSQAQTVAGQAITTANAAVDWRLSYAAEGSPEGDRRTAVCQTLCAVLQTQRRVVENTISCLAGVFAADPELATAVMRPPADYAPAPAPVTAAQVSHSNLQHLRADLGAADSGTRTFAAKVLGSLDKAAADGTVAQLLIYQPGVFDGQGRASIGVGDVATARHLAILTPGILSSPSDMNGTITLAGNLKADAEQVAPGESTAVVVWFGYDIPGSAGKDSVDQGGIGDTVRLVSNAAKALDAHVAQSGGTLLAADTRWVKNLSSPGSSITMIGHSMGSVVTSEAARYSIPADNMVLLAAPGAGYDAQSASDYASVDPDQVFVLSFPQDPVTVGETDFGAALGEAMINGPSVQQPFGTDPAGHLFGAQQIDAPSNSSIMFDGSSFYDSHGMDNYLGGAAGMAVAQVITGRTSRVKRKQGR